MNDRIKVMASWL